VRAAFDRHNADAKFQAEILINSARFPEAEDMRVTQHQKRQIIMGRPGYGRTKRPQSDVELMTEKQILGFKPAP
jgi:hypothetical protein